MKAIDIEKKTKMIRLKFGDGYLSFAGYNCKKPQC